MLQEIKSQLKYNKKQNEPSSSEQADTSHLTEDDSSVHDLNKRIGEEPDSDQIRVKIPSKKQIGRGWIII